MVVHCSAICSGVSWNSVAISRMAGSYIGVVSAMQVLLIQLSLFGFLLIFQVSATIAVRVVDVLVGRAVVVRGGGVLLVVRILMMVVVVLRHVGHPQHLVVDLLV